ncbi:MAG: hypothetical protein PHO56_02620 [Patescibacteria group bacterium]|nr:hypothetical protein [Patescibacteria group bacterium]
MPLEHQPEIAVSDNEAIINAEEIWGGDESEWADWRTAAPEERDLDLAGFMAEQRKLILSEETRDAYAAAFAKKFGPMPMPEPSDDDLANFFLANGGSIYFKRRTYWRRHDQDFKYIENYYQNRLWEKETIKHAVNK